MSQWFLPLSLKITQDKMKPCHYRSSWNKFYLISHEYNKVSSSKCTKIEVCLKPMNANEIMLTDLEYNQQKNINQS